MSPLLHRPLADVLLVPAQTTIMAAAYDGGVVLGADSRTSTGNYVVRFTALLSRLCAPARLPARSKHASRLRESCGVGRQIA